MTTPATQLTITIPEGAPPGSILQIPIRGGEETVKARVPEGLSAGSTLVLTKLEGSDEWVEDFDARPLSSRHSSPVQEKLQERERPVPPTSLALPQTGPPPAPVNGPVAYTVRLDTTVGVIDIIVRPDWAPHGARRFLELAAYGDLDDLAFYRSVKGCLAQFGLPPKRTWPALPDDPPTGVPFLLGAVCFAAVGQNSRKSTLFICIGDMSHNFGQQSWETPIGAVAECSLDVLDRIETIYGDIAECNGAGPNTGRINAEGNDYLGQDFPLLTYIRSAHPLDWQPPSAPEAEQVSQHALQAAQASEAAQAAKAAYASETAMAASHAAALEREEAAIRAAQYVQSGHMEATGRPAQYPQPGHMEASRAGASGPPWPPAGPSSTSASTLPRPSGGPQSAGPWHTAEPVASASRSAHPADFAGQAQAARGFVDVHVEVMPRSNPRRAGDSEAGNWWPAPTSQEAWRVPAVGSGAMPARPASPPASMRNGQQPMYYGGPAPPTDFGPHGMPQGSPPGMPHGPAPGSGQYGMPQSPQSGSMHQAPPNGFMEHSMPQGPPSRGMPQPLPTGSGQHVISQGPPPGPWQPGMPQGPPSSPGQYGMPQAPPQGPTQHGMPQGAPPSFMEHSMQGPPPGYMEHGMPHVPKPGFMEYGMQQGPPPGSMQHGIGQSPLGFMQHGMLQAPPPGSMQHGMPQGPPMQHGLPQGPPSYGVPHGVPHSGSFVAPPPQMGGPPSPMRGPPTMPHPNAYAPPAGPPQGGRGSFTPMPGYQQPPGMLSHGPADLVDVARQQAAALAPANTSFAYEGPPGFPGPSPSWQGPQNFLPPGGPPPSHPQGLWMHH